MVGLGIGNVVGGDVFSDEGNGTGNRGGDEIAMDTVAV